MGRSDELNLPVIPHHRRSTLPAGAAQNTRSAEHRPCLRTKSGGFVVKPVRRYRVERHRRPRSGSDSGHQRSARMRIPRIGSKWLLSRVTIARSCSIAVAAMRASGSLTPDSRAMRPARSATARLTGSSRNGASSRAICASTAVSRAALTLRLSHLLVRSGSARVEVDEVEEHPLVAGCEPGEFPACGLDHPGGGGDVLGTGVHVSEQPLERAGAKGGGARLL